MSLSALPFSPWKAAGAGAVLLTLGLLALAPSGAVWALVFLGAVLYALDTARRHDLSVRRAVRVTVFLTVVAGLTVPALIGLFNLGYHTQEALLQANPLFRRDLGLLLLVTAGTIAAARFWPDRLGDRVFVPLAVALAILAKLAYVWAIQADAVSDFAGMWTVATSLTEEGWAATHHGLDQQWYSWVHFERVLPFLFPVRAAFGPKPVAYTVANVFLGAATSLLTWRLARIWFGRPAGRVALAVSLLAIETALMAEIPSHEVPGAFYTLAALTLFQIAWDLYAKGRHRAALWAGAAFGLAALVLDVQRSTGSVLLLATGFLGLGMAAGGASPRDWRVRGSRLRRGVLLALLPLLVFKAADLAAREAGFRTPKELQNKGGGIGLASATDSGSDGSYTYFWDNYFSRYELDEESWYRFALVKLASDTHASPAARLSLYLRKARTLFALGTQTYFYLPNGKLRGEPLGLLSQRIFAASLGFSSLFLAALIVAVTRLWRLPDLPFSTLAPLFFLALFSVILLLLAEVQPRYLYPLWYIGPIYAGVLLGRPACSPSTT